MNVRKLPNAHCAFVEEEKICQYLLNPDHKEGASKAKFFSERGFRISAWQALAEALVKHGRERKVTQVRETEYGTRYSVDCRMETPEAHKPCIRTVWEVVDDRPRLITAHPLK